MTLVMMMAISMSFLVKIVLLKFDYKGVVFFFYLLAMKYVIMCKYVTVNNC